jgi:hypothetical protein
MNSTSELSIVAKSLGVADTDQGNITILAEKDVYADAGGAVRIVSSGNYGSATNSNLDRKTTDSGIQLLSDSSIVLRSKNGPGITTDFFGIKEFQDSGDYGEDGIYKEHSSIYVLSSQNVRIMAEATAGTVFLDGSAVLLGSKDDGSYLEVKDDIIIDSQGLFKVEAQAGVNISADSVSIVSDELNLIADSNTGIVNISAFDVVITANNTTGQILFDAPSSGSITVDDYFNQMTNNNIGAAQTFRHKSGSINFNNNNLQGTINSFATQSLLYPSGAISGPTANGNVHAGSTTVLSHISSSIIYINNVFNFMNCLF